MVGIAGPKLFGLDSYSDLPPTLVQTTITLIFRLAVNILSDSARKNAEHV